MGRLKEQEISRIKSEVSLEAVVTVAGVRLKRHGKDLLGLCPFHDDREPSLVVTPAKNLWHCLGACQAGGSVVDWVMRAERVSFRHAVELLRERYIPSLVASERPKAARTPKTPVPLKTGKTDQQILEWVLSYYQETLQQSPEAQEYLKQRGIESPELIQRFRLGFANRTLAYKLPPKSQKAGTALREQLTRLGVFRESGHEHLNGSLIIPILGEGGEVLGMYGRKVTRNLRVGTPKHLYLPGPHRGVWNLSAFRESGEIILCESLIDACTFWSAGYRNVTCAYGVEGFTDELKRAFLEHATERVLIAYDRDEAGDKAAAKLAKELGAAGIECFRVKFPKGMDANSYALKVMPAQKSLGVALRQAEWMGEGKAPERSVATTTAPPPMPKAGATPAPAESASPVAAALPADDAREAAKKEKTTGLERAPSGSEPTLSLVAPAAPEEVADVHAATAPPAAKTPSSKPKMRDQGDEAFLVLGDRTWRARGLSKLSGPGSLKVNLLVTRANAGFFVDTLDLYSARHRGAFVKEAAAELNLEERVVKHDLGEVLLSLEQLLDERAKADQAAKEAPKKMSDNEREAALGLLKSPNLIERIVGDFDQLGVVGEVTNKLIGYLAATSRKLEEPLAVVIQSSSAAGKSSLMDAILKMVPEEERQEYSAMTGQSLFYMGESDLRHKILAIVEEEGAERASYALKLLQSEGELTIASTGKDPVTGRLVTEEYRVAGPVTILLTTTAVDIDEELLNRCLVLTVDEGREQTRKIHKRQRRRRTLEGMAERNLEKQLMRLHQNAQRLLEPLFVVNPYAEFLGFPDHQTRLRRDHKKYLGLIEALALLHQHQRPIKELKQGGEILRYIEVEPRDIELANHLAREVLGRSLDELPPQTRRLLKLLDELVTAGCEAQGLERRDFRLTRREVREATGWGDTQLRVHLSRLIELEYLLVHRGRQGQSYQYELLFVSEHGTGPYLAGLVEVSDLLAATSSTTRTSRGAEGNLAGVMRGASGPDAGGVRGVVNKPKPQKNQVADEQATHAPETPRPRPRVNGTLYRGVVQQQAPTGAVEPAALS